MYSEVIFLAGYWQESTTITITNGSTASVVGNGSVVVPYRAVYLSQVTASVTNGTTEQVYVYETSGNGTSNGTTALADENLIYANATFSASFLNVRNLWRFGTTTGRIEEDKAKLFVSVIANGTNGTNGTTITATVTLGGFGLN